MGSGYFLLGGAASPALVIRVKNVAEVVKAQGGAIAAAANYALPEFVEAKVYETIKEQLSTEFKKKGVDTQIDISSAPPVGPAPNGKRDFLTGVVVGGGVAVGGWLLWTRVIAKHLLPLLTRSGS